MNIIIHVDDLVLRKWTSADIDSLADVGNDPSIAINMNDGFPNPYTKEKAKAFIENAIKSNNLLLAIVKGTTVIGSIGAFFDDNKRGEAVIAYFIGKNYWNHGYGSKAIKGIIEYLKIHRGIKKITAKPFERNLSSRKVLEKNEFVLREIIKDGGTKGNESIDICIYEYGILS